MFFPIIKDCTNLNHKARAKNDLPRLSSTLLYSRRSLNDVPMTQLIAYGNKNEIVFFLSLSCKFHGFVYR
jgi:hypothetical protein